MADGDDAAPERETIDGIVVQDDADAWPFRFIDPPFQFNAPEVAAFPAEVSGAFLLKAMARRLGWTGLSGKRILDFGCGVRFARTILNLDFDVDLYCGVDVNADSIAWLQSNVDDPRMRFRLIGVRNAMYNPAGEMRADAGLVRELSACDFDCACMFSVITHQNPEETVETLTMLHDILKPRKQLYFTAFVDPAFDFYGDASASPGLMSTYHPRGLARLARDAGWRIEAVYAKAPFQQHAFVCRRL